MKAKNFVTLTVDSIYCPPGIGVPGVSSTDTNNPLYIGGHPQPAGLSGFSTIANYVGCMKNVKVDNKDISVLKSDLFGDVMPRNCPTI